MTLKNKFKNFLFNLIDLALKVIPERLLVIIFAVVCFFWIRWWDGGENPKDQK